MEYSDDPQFHGATNIVNFIMHDYVAGGLTKFDGEQVLPNSGSYSAASKLVWGKMTYNAMFKGGYSRDHQSGRDLTESYDNICYNGEWHDKVLRQEHTGEIKRGNNIYGGFNARYKTDKTMILHSLALQWDEDPGSVSRGAVEYDPEIINADKMAARSASHSLSPSLEGLYTFIPSSKWNLSVNWVLSHSHNDNEDSYEDSGLTPILTRSRENIYNIVARVTAVWNVRNNLVFQCALQENRSTSKTDYAGEVSSRQWQNTGSNKLQLLGWWRISNKVALTVKPEIILQDWNINHSIKKTEWLPGVNANIGWAVNDRNGIGFECWFYQKNPAASQRNNLTLRSTELKWMEGNPDVGSSSNYWLSLNYSSYPTSWLTNRLTLNFITNSNEAYLSYRSGGTTYDGVIGRFANAGASHTYLATWDFNLSFFDSQIRIGNQLEYRHQRMNGVGLDNVRTRPYISWDFGNCSLSANYGSPEKFFRQGGTETVKTDCYYNLDFSYGNGNFLFDLELSAPFQKHLTTTTVCNNGPYHFNSANRCTGRCVSVSLSYTFDYGKKVTPGVDIYEQNIHSSSVLGSD